VPRTLTESEIAEIQERYSDRLNYGADDILSPIDPLTYVQPDGDGLLHIAAIRGDARTISLLLEAGLDPNSIGDMGETPLHYAYSFDHNDVVKILLEHGANPNIRSEFGLLPGEE
jgi:ankyrin repeat protein